MPSKIILIAVSVAIIGASSEIIDIPDYWPEYVSDLTDISWSHKTNTIHALDEALNDDLINMIESDVNIGHVFGDLSSEPIPIMAHPPTIVSDQSLAMYINTSIAAITAGAKKGMKLDFKTIDIVEESFLIVKEYEEEINFPFWINADILTGPGSASSKLVDSSEFLRLAKEYFPTATLSTGWTTSSGAGEETGMYTQAMVEEMISTLAANEIGEQTVTFPARAIYVGNSNETLTWLLDQSAAQSSTLTIWGTDDIADVDQLRAVIDSIGRDRIYLDVPEELANQIGREKKDS